MVDVLWEATDGVWFCGGSSTGGCVGCTELSRFSVDGICFDLCGAVRSGEKRRTADGDGVGCRRIGSP